MEWRRGGTLILSSEPSHGYKNGRSLEDAELVPWLSAQKTSRGNPALVGSFQNLLSFYS